MSHIISKLYDYERLWKSQLSFIPEISGLTSDEREEFKKIIKQSYKIILKSLESDVDDLEKEAFADGKSTGYDHGFDDGFNTGACHVSNKKNV